jgi:hypothetical protein
MGHAEHRATLTTSIHKRRDSMKLNKTLGPEAGFFHLFPDLRFSEPLVIPRGVPNPPVMVDQTELVKMVYNLSIDEGLAPAFAPFPISQGAFSQHEDLTASYELEDGTRMLYFVLRRAFEEDVLPEANGELQEVTNMQVGLKSTEPSQWWLCADPYWIERFGEAGIAFLKDARGNSCWIASYDEYEESFWDTSIGRCLVYIEHLRTTNPEKAYE